MPQSTIHDQDQGREKWTEGLKDEWEKNWYIIIELLTVSAYEWRPLVAVVKDTVNVGDSENGRMHSTAICIRTSSPPNNDKGGQEWGLRMNVIKSELQET